MNLIDKLSRRKHLLSYTLVFDSKEQLSVKVDEVITPLSNDEYIRLWAFYYTKMILKLNYPENIDTFTSISMIEKIIGKVFDRETDCFERAGLSDNICYTEEPITGMLTFFGRFYSKNQNRIFVANFPADIVDKYAIYGAIGLLQYAINRCIKNGNGLDLAYNTVKTFVSLLKTTKNVDLDRIKSFPDKAYAMSLRHLNDSRRHQ